MKFASFVIPAPAIALVTSADWFVDQTVPIINCHAGCGAHFPAYSEAAIADAFLNGSNFLEVTLQASADGVLMLNEDLCLAASTSAPA